MLRNPALQPLPGRQVKALDQDQEPEAPGFPLGCRKLTAAESNPLRHHRSLQALPALADCAVNQRPGGLDLITADHFSGARNAEIFSVLAYLPRLHRQA
jgi:hypothetical protein